MYLTYVLRVSPAGTMGGFCTVKKKKERKKDCHQLRCEIQDRGVVAVQQRF
jgi:hypothetical protein